MTQKTPMGAESEEGRTLSMPEAWSLTTSGGRRELHLGGEGRVAAEAAAEPPNALHSTVAAEAPRGAGVETQSAANFTSPTGRELARGFAADSALMSLQTPCRGRRARAPGLINTPEGLCEATHCTKMTDRKGYSAFY